MKQALILHGTAASSHENWFPWLKQELEKKEWKVWVPDLPDSEKPDITRYTAFLLSNPNWDFTNHTYLIGHSSGAVAILGLLQRLPEDIKVDTCILVGAFKDDLGWESLKRLFIEPFNFVAIKHKAKHFILIHSDNDPYCPLDHARYLANQLDAKLIIKPGQGHFNTEQGEHYRQFPFLLEKIEQLSRTT